MIEKRVGGTIGGNTETSTEREDEPSPKQLQTRRGRHLRGRRRRLWRWRYTTISFVAMRYQGNFGYAAEPSRLGREASLQRSNVLLKQLLKSSAGSINGLWWVVMVVCLCVGGGW